MTEWLSEWNSLVDLQSFGMVWENLGTFIKEEKLEYWWKHEHLTTSIKMCSVPTTKSFNLCDLTWFLTTANGSRQIIYNIIMHVSEQIKS